MTKIFSISLIASLVLGACASTSGGPENNLMMALNTSCDDPLIVRHPNSQAEQGPYGAQIKAVHRYVKVSLLGYYFTQEKEADLRREFPDAEFRLASYPEPTTTACPDYDISRYSVHVSKDRISPPIDLYVRHLPRSIIDFDPRYRCAPTYRQIYQPPLTLGGAGRVMNIHVGESCEDISQTANE